MPIEFHRDGPWELPEGWVWARLGDICRYPGRINPARQLKGNFRYIDLSAVEDGKITQPQNISVTNAPSRARQPTRTGDTLLSCVRVYLQNNAIVPDELDGSVASTAFCVLRPTEAIDPHYLFWFVHSRKFTEILIPLQRGNSPPAVLDEDVRDQFIPIAPLPEQRRIASRIDELLTEIMDGETALTRARDDLDTWRRALIKAAVTGEITRGWRAHNKPNETGAEVLARVAKARMVYKATKTRGRKFITEEIGQDTLPAIPDTWAWARLGELGDIVCGITVDKKRRPDDPITVPYLRVANVQRSRLDLTQIKTIVANRDAAAALYLQAGDILLNEGGDRDKIGRGWVWNGEIEKCIHQNHVFRVRLFDRSINPYFISHFANEMGRRFFVEKGKQTTNLASISLSKISQLRIPIPPIAEMDEAMRILDEMLSATVDVEAELRAASMSSPARQSILKAAFEGRLIEQDPRDEFADHLVARVSEHAAEATQPHRARRLTRAALAAR
jgi:type I restriction enzyme, S subunit